MLVLAVPHLNSNVKTLLLSSGQFHNSDVDLHVGQVLGDGSSWSCNRHFSGLHGHLDYS